jgi:hypothetical protein
MAENNNWTIMIYMAGDNDLNLEMAYALNQIKLIKKHNPNVNLYEYFDGFSSNVPTLYCDFSDDSIDEIDFYRSFKVEDKLIKRDVNLENDFNENSASVNNILNFIDWCVKKDKNVVVDGQTTDTRPDKKYAMILSGHSFGFLNWGLFKDEKANYTMTLSKLKWMFERITDNTEQLLVKAAEDQAEARLEAEKKKYNFTPWSQEKLTERTTEILGKPFDLLGFDSCVMSTLEIGSQFKGLAETMVASEGSIPAAGWNYAQILLGKIKDGKETKEIAVNFVDEFIRQQNKFALADISVDMAAWDLTALGELEKSFGELSENLLKCFYRDKSDLSEPEKLVYNQMKRLLVDVHSQCQTYLFEQHIDLGDFCQLLFKEIEQLKTEIDCRLISPIIDVGNSCKAVDDRITDCILLTGFSGSDYQYSNGISLFFPWSLQSYQSAEKDYKKLSFIRDENSAGKKWNEFLEDYLRRVTLRKPKPLTETKNGVPVVAADTSSIVYESYSFNVSIG